MHTGDRVVSGHQRSLSGLLQKLRILPGENYMNIKVPAFAKEYSAKLSASKKREIWSVLTAPKKGRASLGRD